MIKFILSLLLLFSLLQTHGQSINNKNAPIDRTSLIKSNNGTIEVYRQIDLSNKDSIVSKNFIADTDNYFDLIVIKLNKKKSCVMIIEYSPKDKEFKKFTEYEYNNKKDQLIHKRSGIMLPPANSCIGGSSDPHWTDVLGFSTLLSESIYFTLLKELNIKQ